MKFRHFTLIGSMLFIIVGCGTTQHSLTNQNESLVTEDELSEDEILEIWRGIRLHDEGDFVGARASYDTVLSTKPNSSFALYQKAYAYQQEGNYEACIETATHGTSIGSSIRYLILHMHGICLDMAGQLDEALQVFKIGIAEQPDYLLLNHSIGVTLARLSRYDEAIKTYESVIAIDESHAGSHLGIAQAYEAQNLKFAAALAYTYYLFYERDTERSFVARDDLLTLLTSLRPSNDGDRSVININLNLLTGIEDPMNSAELTLALSAVSNKLHEKPDLMVIENLSNQLSTIFRIAGDLIGRPGTDGVIWTLYAPFLSQLEAAGHTEALTYLNFQGTGLEGVDEWLEENNDKVHSLTIWLEVE